MKLRAHIDRVGMRIPTVEVRFENMTVNVECLVDGRALPILVNSAKNFLDTMLGTIGLTSTRKKKLTILKDDSGIIKPPRLTLLLGQPGSRKSTLLLALVGRLDKELKASGSITYNGHSLDEFVPQKNSAYISQNDLHVGVMTVRETLNFSTKCQGVGSKYEMLYELDKREKEARIVPDTEVDIFMKETSVEDVKSSLQTDYSLMILGLDICAETILGDEMIRGPIRIDYSIFLPKYVRSKFQVI